MPVLIEAHNLRKVFGETVAVKNLSLQVAAGEIYGLVGPDGAGKTTSMRLICGALQPSRGSEAESTSVFIGGYDVNRQTERARAQIGYLPQRFSLYEELTVIENIRFFAEVRGLPSAQWKPRCMQILEFVGLDQFTGRRAGFLSGGMKQKLGLAAALVHRPRVLLLDEPTTGVDPVTRQDFWQLIIRLVANNDDQASGVAVLVSTPYMDEAARCSRVGFMRDGLLIIEGPPARLRSVLEGRILELRGSPLRLLRHLSEQDPDVEAVQMFGDRMHMRVRDGKTQEVETRLKNRINTEGIDNYLLRPMPSQLEDVFNLLIEQEAKTT
jgi:ABC-2 type transport system ATP-binding protein